MWTPVRRVLIGIVLVGLAMLTRPNHSQSKNPSWTPADHPRLIASPAEKSQIVAKLTSPGTASSTIWSQFLTSNFRYYSRNYADGAFQYWITGNTTVGQEAVAAAEDWMATTPDGLSSNSSSFDESWYRYVDFLLTYDFTYDLIVAAGKKQTFLDYIALQTAKCHAAGPGWGPGNINTLWMFCSYAGSEEMEGEGSLTKNFVDEPVVRNGASSTADPVKTIINASNIRIANTAGSGATDYVENVDYLYHYVPSCGALCIDWSPSGAGTHEPANGATYYVSYTFTPDPVLWKADARVAIEYHLNYNWHDGYYQGGLNPYGNLVAEELPTFIEMLKRDTGIDYGQSPDVKKIVDMYMYSKLPNPGTGVGVPIRFNTINDTNSWSPGYANAWTYPNPGFATYKSWLRPLVAWGTTRYANDPEGYGERYVWLWSQAYRNANGSIRYNPVADWREALWINDAAIAPYFNTPAVPSASWSRQRYFRGRELIVSQSGNWNQSDINASYMSLVSGNHNYQNEHDQGDSGSFTFFSLNEDWGIDPGYGATALSDHNSVDIDGGGFQASGIYGVAGATSSWGGSTHFGDVALNDDASLAAVDLASAWTLTTTPYVHHDQRYTALVNGGRQPYLVVADDIQKDSSAHNYQWYLHTGVSNTVSIAGNQATITGARTGATMKVYSLGPESSSWTSASSSTGNVGTRQRLVDTAAGTVQARFLHLLLPTAAGQAAPVISRSVITNGIQAIVTWADGVTDTIIWRTGGSSITSTNGVVSDARLTIVRRQGATVLGVTMQEGRSVVVAGITIIQAVDGTQPFTVAAMGETATISANDASQFRLQVSGVTTATLEDGEMSVPVSSDGSIVYINTGLPVATERRNQGLLAQFQFDDGYLHNFFRFNISHNPAEQFSTTGNVLTLSQSPYEWPSFSRRDSTPWRRTGLWPTMIPTTEYGNGDYAFRYRFTDMSGGDRKFQVYFATQDRTAADWATNQDYFRLDLRAMQSGVPQNQVVVGQRVNGSWSTLGDNETLTSTLPTGSATLANTNWHTVAMHVENGDVEVTIDGQPVLSGTLPVSLAAGYLQWKVTGTSTVQLDDVQVVSLDHTDPVAPTAGELYFTSGLAHYQLTYGHGASTDQDRLRFYSSPTPIDPQADPGTLTLVATTPTAAASGTFVASMSQTYYAVSVLDPSDNRSELVPLVIDTVGPAAVTDFRPQ